MNTHQREWIVSVASVKDATTRDIRKFSAQLVRGSRCQWQFRSGDEAPVYGRITSSAKYFTAELDSSDNIQNPYEPTEVRRGKATSYEYPIYLDELNIGRRSCFIIAAPYVDLIREIWRKTHLVETGVSFMAPSIELMFEDILNHSPKSIDEALDGRSSLTVLRGARINFADDPNLRGAVLVGENVMQSRLYKQLAPALGGGGPIWLAEAVAKVGFWGSLRRRVVVQMDRFGNFRLRPGAGGIRLVHFKEFLHHLADINAITWRPELPVDRVLNLAGEGRN